MFFPAVVGPDGSYRWIRKDTREVSPRGDFISTKLNFATKEDCVGFLMAKTLNVNIIGIIYDTTKGIFLPLKIEGFFISDQVMWYDVDSISQRIKHKKIGD